MSFICGGNPREKKQDTDGSEQYREEKPVER